MGPLHAMRIACRRLLRSFPYRLKDAIFKGFHGAALATDPKSKLHLSPYICASVLYWQVCKFHIGTHRMYIRNSRGRVAPCLYTLSFSGLCTPCWRRCRHRICTVHCNTRPVHVPSCSLFPSILFPSLHGKNHSSKLLKLLFQRWEAPCESVPQALGFFHRRPIFQRKHLKHQTKPRA